MRRRFLDLEFRRSLTDGLRAGDGRTCVLCARVTGSPVWTEMDGFDGETGCWIVMLWV